MTETNTAHRASNRHFGMDWLRIGAFAILILYHIAMVFAPWNWVIHADVSYNWLIPPMALTTPWRLSLLFAVSGFASYHLFRKAGSADGFLWMRSKRLLIPLTFGMVFFVPPEMWVRVAIAGYPHDLTHFWVYDYWRIGEFWGRLFPSWEHLWFVLYLWAYSALLALALRRWPDRIPALISAVVDWLSVGHRLIWMPIILLATARIGTQFLIPDQVGLLTDWAGHTHYFPVFIAGYAVAANPRIWSVIHREWRLALAVTLVASVPLLWIEITYPGIILPPHEEMAILRLVQKAMGWSVTLLLFNVANRFLNHDHPWRRTFAEAVFPFYLIHQPAIVILAWFILPLQLGEGVHFLSIAFGTIVICVIFYLVGRSIPWARPLIGLGGKMPRRQNS